jgi:MFS transporter, ACS family, hexuronate transporter
MLIPLLSDYVGRKTVVIPSLFILGAGFITFLLSGPNFLFLALSVSVAGFVVGGIAPIALSALVVESVPPELAGTASGIPISLGEILGGAIMPLLAGYLGDLYGLKATLYFAALSPIIAGCVSFFYKETAPRVLQRRAAVNHEVPEPN